MSSGRQKFSVNHRPVVRSTAAPQFYWGFQIRLPSVRLGGGGRVRGRLAKG